jgi:hypothetical protein
MRCGGPDAAAAAGRRLGQRRCARSQRSRRGEAAGAGSAAPSSLPAGAPRRRDRQIETADAAGRRHRCAAHGTQRAAAAAAAAARSLRRVRRAAQQQQHSTQAHARTQTAVCGTARRRPLGAVPARGRPLSTLMGAYRLEPLIRRSAAEAATAEPCAANRPRDGALWCDPEPARGTPGRGRSAGCLHLKCAPPRERWHSLARREAEGAETAARRRRVGSNEHKSLPVSLLPACLARIVSRSAALWWSEA